ncbi:hypothetical protein [Rickettsiella endosymbiont of Rhagonycha lignosa]|uniref:hypothetical protein n=1 Tax=Rickettsiella endosymbiont of Rhagonycha lignosa TaxID=3077937 RepID=UPI00313E980A
MQKFTKEIFLNFHRSHQISSLGIDSIINHFREKKIKIIKNGKKSPELLAEKRKKNSIRIAPTLEKLRDPNSKYSTYIQLNYLSPGETKQNHLCISNISPPFWKDYSDITQSINKFILPSGHLNPDLSDSEIIKLNETASQLACKPLLDQQIDYHIQSLQDVCLDKFEVKHEVEEIRKTLKKDEKIGYIFTNNTDKTKEHIECLILTRKNIIKPITWNYFSNSGISHKSQLLDSDFLGIPLFMPDLSFFIDTDNPPTLPHPQADPTSCGSLCLSLLYKLLKNNAAEFNTLTLTFSFYDRHGKKKHFFLPPPSLLMYSQSYKYIEFQIRIMDATDKTVYRESLNQEGTTIWTLQGLLNYSLGQAKKMGDTDMFYHNSAILNELSILRPHWLEAAKQAIEERKKMDDPTGNKNLYLKYQTKKLENIFFNSHPRNLNVNPAENSKNSLIDHSFQSIKCK